MEVAEKLFQMPEATPERSQGVLGKYTEQSEGWREESAKILSFLPQKTAKYDLEFSCLVN